MEQHQDPKIESAKGGPLPEDYREIDPASGQQKAYAVLSEEERAKGFVRPVRYSYVHRGARPKYGIRPVTPEEKERWGDDADFYEKYPPSQSGPLGHLWTKAELQGCGAVTTMGRALAETYARDPKFYSGTFCVGCGKHLPLNQFVWDKTDEIVGS
jgi:hypothetical protein